MVPILDFLGQLADSLCTAVDDGAGGQLVHVAATDDGLTVGLLDLEGAPPADVLLGTVAPDDWVALGVATGGWAHPLDAGPGDRRGPTRTVVVVLVLRSGDVVSRLRVGDEMIHEPPAYGLTLDCLQRALGLPTAPPLASTGDLFARMWLADVVAAAEEQRGALTWAQARARHPAIVLLEGTEPIAGADDPVLAGRALERALDWEQLRWMAVEGRWSAGPLTPTDAAWCDAGAFSRWVLDRRPDVDALLVEVKQTAGSGVARRCAAVLRRLGVLGPSCRLTA